MKGIYSLTINNKVYIGKDTQLHKKRRLKQHLHMLKQNNHYNKHLQHAFNKYHGRYEYEIVYQSEKITDGELLEKEKYYIKIFDSFHTGFNLTEGGEGMGGFKFSDESNRKKSEKLSGEKNPLSKITNEQFFEIAELLKDGCTNSEIAIKYNLHSRYISLIRHKKRFKKLWEQVDDYQPTQSGGRYKNGKINEVIFQDIVGMIKAGETNADIERKYGLASGCVSRIRHKEHYRQWWRKFFNE